MAGIALGGRRGAATQWVGPRLLRLALVIRAILAATIVWWLLAELFDQPLLLPGPVAVVKGWWQLLGAGDLFEQTSVSLRRLSFGYIAAAVGGITLGMAMGQWGPVDRAVSPLVNSVRAVSGIAWIPIAVAWFGVGDFLPIFIIFYGAVFPFILNAQAGIRSVDERLVHAARTLGASGRTIALRVTLPAVLPYLLSGARIALGLAWMSIIAAELLGAPSGLGYSIQYARLLQQTPRMLAWILWVGVVGYVLDAAMRAAIERAAPWSTAGRLGGARL